MLQRVASRLGISSEAWMAGSTIQASLGESQNLQQALIDGGRSIQLNLYLIECRLSEIQTVLEDRSIVILIQQPSDTFYVISRQDGRQYSAQVLTQDDTVISQPMKAKELEQLLGSGQVTALAARRLLEGQQLAARSGQQSNFGFHQQKGFDHREHLSPWKRAMALVRMDRSDIASIALFTAISSFLSLASPLAVESLVNVVSWGIYLQPLVILALVLLISLTLSALFGILQAVVVEIIQRRQFVRITCDLAHRFPQVDRSQVADSYPREMANRIFDIMTIQKASAVLLLDGINIVVVTAIGMLLLAFYHPFLLGLDIILLFLMAVVTCLLGLGGTSTALKESKIKYSMVHWLQDVIDNPFTFGINGGERLAIERSNLLATDYVLARKAHFKVLMRQLIFVSGLQVLALTSVLGLGGWLVVKGELTLGQLVASELVVTLIMGAFSKSGKSLEKVFDLMAGLDKVGHLLDLETRPTQTIAHVEPGPASINWSELKLSSRDGFLAAMPKTRVPAGQLFAILAADYGDVLTQTLAGLIKPAEGMVQIGECPVTSVAASNQQGRLLAVAAPELFHATLASAIDLGNASIGTERVREVLHLVGAKEILSQLSDGQETLIESHGYPLSPTRQVRLFLARGLANRPRLLIVDRILDQLSAEDQTALLNVLRSLKSQTTSLVITASNQIAQQCDDRCSLIIH
jgi:putative ABC transport system ATP-binding protein